MPWTLVGQIAAITDQAAASLVSGATATRNAVDARITTRTASAVAEALSNNTVVRDAAVAAMSDAAVQAQLAWAKGSSGLPSNPGDITESGSYQRAGGISATNGYPVSWSGVNVKTELHHRAMGTGSALQVLRVSDGVLTRTWVRTMHSGAWGAWAEQPSSEMFETLANSTMTYTGSIGGGELGPQIEKPGSFLRNGSFFASQGYPINGTGTAHIFHTQSTVSGAASTASTLAVIYDTTTGVQSLYMKGRNQGVDGPWVPVQGGARWQAGVETNGEWTPLADEIALLKSFATHRDVEYMEIGTSVNGRVIPAIRIGHALNEDGTKRATVLFTAGVHGNEMGPREGALRLARELIQDATLARYRVSIIIVPNVNPDGFQATTRNNAAGVNLNRDFIANTQPETQAVRALIDRENIVAAADLHNGGAGLRPNFIEPTESLVAADVFERSRRMFDAAWERILDIDEEPFRYPYPPDDAGLFHEGMASQYRIPSLLLEVPFIPQAGLDERALPPRTWTARMTAEFCHSIIDTVWRERDAFQAVRNGAAYTIPARYMSAIEQGRHASAVGDTSTDFAAIFEGALE